MQLKPKSAAPTAKTLFAELREGLQIERHALDQNMIEQPMLYATVSEAYVQACGERDAAKEKVAAVDAELASQIRTDWNRLGEKYTEARVGDAVQMTLEHVEAYTAYQALVSQAGYLLALKDAYEQRAKMLRELGMLYVSGYFDKVVSNAGRKDVDAAAAAAGREALKQARFRSRTVTPE